MKQTNLTELERNNRVAMMAHAIDSSVMVLFCVLQFAGGLQTAAYVLLVAVLGLGPVAAEYICWKKNRENPAIKHLVAIGFAVFYTVCLFTSFNNLVFAFVIPMLLVIPVYNDIRYSVLINIGTVLESFIVVIVGAKTGKFGYHNEDSGIIQIVIMILVAIYSVLTAKTLNENSKQKVASITAAQNKTESVLSDISSLSEKMKNGIEGIYKDLEKLNQASDTTKDAMKEVSSGALETAEAVQNQLLQTEAIQNKVGVVDDASKDITDNMQKTLSVLENGRKNIETLVAQVDVSVENGGNVEKKLNDLDTYMEEMNSIVEIISGITTQTKLLALNASIEAARAGEAGKGFAVVADEISGMATETNEATVHITDLIQNVSTAIREVVGVIQQMIAGINEEKEGAADTAESFDSIRSNTFAIRDNVKSLAESIEELKDANHVIVDSIQTISAISEEVSAHANMTLDAEEKNAGVLTEIADKMQELIRHTRKS